MNIFILDTDPVIAAQMQCDKHVVKMILETAQLLCSVFPDGKAPYKKTHINHPCSKWTRESSCNYMWLLDHGNALVNEYTFRYDKVHKSAAVISWCKDNIKYTSFERHIRTKFKQCMPEIYHDNDPVVAYRNYYIGEKKKIAKWNKARKAPDWFKLK
jgi:hypothetical protein